MTSHGWAGSTRPWGITPSNFQPWGGAARYTRPWVQPYMQPSGKIQRNVHDADATEPGSTKNIEIMPAYPTQQSYQQSLSYQPSQSYQPYQSYQPSLSYQPYQSYQSYQPPQPYAAAQSPTWSRSYSPIPGNGNCFNTCRNRCGSYSTYSGCRPSCSSRCNIRPSCPSLTGSDYSYSDSTLYCGTSQGYAGHGGYAASMDSINAMARETMHSLSNTSKEQEGGAQEEDYEEGSSPIV